jgi:large subunit ribosomal protein L25
MNEEVEAEVRLVFVGEAPAVKEKGGNLVTSMDHLKIKCLPKDLPHEISIDLSSLVDFGDSITVGSLALPSGVTVEDDPSATIASVAAVKEEKLDAAAPEVVIAEAQNQGPEAPVSTADDKQTGDKGGKKEEKK